MEETTLTQCIQHDVHSNDRALAAVEDDKHLAATSALTSNYTIVYLEQVSIPPCCKTHLLSEPRQHGGLLL